MELDRIVDEMNRRRRRPRFRAPASAALLLLLLGVGLLLTLRLRPAPLPGRPEPPPRKPIPTEAAAPTPQAPPPSPPPAVEAGCPHGCAEPSAGCVIKGNISGRTGERIYHLPGGRYYEATVISPAQGEAWFCTEAEARENGWRKSKR